MTIRRTLLISLAGHLVLFGLFGISFGKKLPQISLPHVFFWGRYAPAQGVIDRRPAPGPVVDSWLIPGAGGSRDFSFGPAAPRKPAAFPFIRKENFREQESGPPPAPKRSEDSITLHPVLPYGLTLYFKDREVAHVELAFRIVPRGLRNPVEITRKISSGNLDADLVTMRHMTHFLFIQQRSFAPNTWQGVKIDLSTRGE